MTGPPDGSEVEIRPASAEDLSAMSALMFVEPSREAVAMAGTAARAHRFQRELLRWALDAPGSELMVAQIDTQVVGFAFVSDGGDVPPFASLAAMATRAMGITGALRAAWRASARLAVDLPTPAGGRHLVELQVDPRKRGQGVGGALLDAVEHRAGEAGWSHLSLTTGSTNPARRLYERHGFMVQAQRFGRRYARLTGIPGRVLMVRPTAAPTASDGLA